MAITPINNPTPARPIVDEIDAWADVGLGIGREQNYGQHREIPQATIDTVLAVATRAATVIATDGRPELPHWTPL